MSSSDSPEIVIQYGSDVEGSIGPPLGSEANPVEKVASVSTASTENASIPPIQQDQENSAPR